MLDLKKYQETFRLKPESLFLIKKRIMVEAEGKGNPLYRKEPSIYFFE